MLKRVKNTLYHYVDGKRTEGAHSKITGDVSGLSGDVSGLSGNVDDCGLTDEQRSQGVDINTLVEPD